MKSLKYIILNRLANKDSKLANRCQSSIPVAVLEMEASLARSLQHIRYRLRNYL